MQRICPQGPSQSEKNDEHDSLGVPFLLQYIPRSGTPLPAPTIHNDLLRLSRLLEAVRLLEVDRRHIERLSELGQRDRDGGRDRTLGDFVRLSHVDDVRVLNL